MPKVYNQCQAEDVMTIRACQDLQQHNHAPRTVLQLAPYGQVDWPISLVCRVNDEMFCLLLLFQRHTGGRYGPKFKIMPFRKNEKELSFISFKSN